MNRLIFIFFCFIPFWLIAQQEYSLEWGEQYKHKLAFIPLGIVAHFKNGSFVTLNYRKGWPVLYTLDLFDKDLKKVQSVPVEMKYEDTNLDYEDFIVLDGNLYLLLSFLNKKQKKAYLLARRINSETLKAEGEYIKLAEAFHKNIFDETHFQITTSTNRSDLKMMIYVESEIDEKTEAYFSVWNGKMDKLWDASFEVNDDSGYFDNMEVGQNGDVYILTSKHNDDEASGENTDYALLYWKNGNSDFLKIKINPEKKLLTDGFLRAYGNGKVIYTGFYKEHYKGGYLGAFVLKINIDKSEQDAPAFKPFEGSWVNSKRSNKHLEEKGLHNMNIHGLHLRDDGSMIFSMEAGSSHTSKKDFTNPRSGEKTYYVYGSIYAVNISTEGKIAWIRKINKSQLSIYEFGGSYTMAKQDDLFHFVFYQTPKMGTPDLKVVTLDKEGNLIETTIAKEMDGHKNFHFIPKYSSQVQEDKLILYIQKGTRLFHFGRLTIG